MAMTIMAFGLVSNLYIRHNLPTFAGNFDTKKQYQSDTFLGITINRELSTAPNLSVLK